MEPFPLKIATEAAGYQNKTQDPDRKQNIGEFKQKPLELVPPSLEHLHWAQPSWTESPLLRGLHRWPQWVILETADQSHRAAVGSSVPWLLRAENIALPIWDICWETHQSTLLTAVETWTSYTFLEVPSILPSLQGVVTPLFHLCLPYLILSFDPRSSSERHLERAAVIATTKVRKAYRGEVNFIPHGHGQ